MRRKAALLLLAGSSLFAAQFETGQAARAVFGQPSFSAHEAGVNATSLIVLHDKLYAADASNRVFTYDLTRLGDPHKAPLASSSPDCFVCFASAASSVPESVMPGVATVSLWNKSVAAIDLPNHHVLLWRDTTAARADRGPDVVLGRSNNSGGIGPATLVNPVSVALDGTRLFVGDAALHRVLVWNSLPLSEDQAADAVLGQPDFGSAVAPGALRADSIVTPVAMAADAGNLFVADSASRRILVFSIADRALSSRGVFNSASLLESEPLAPGTLITIRAERLSRTSETASADDGALLPDTLGGVQVILDGLALPLLSLERDQVQAQLPYDLGGRSAGSLYLRIKQGDEITATQPVALDLVAASPGLFALNGREPRGGILLRNGAPVTAESPAHAGDVLTVWGTGLGAVAETGSAASAGQPFEGPAAPVVTPVAAEIDGLSATVLSAKLLPGAVGVYEIQIAVPAPGPHASQMRLAVLQNGFVSNVVTFPVGPVPVARQH